MEKPISVLIKEWSVSNRYLLLPVKNGNERIVLQVLRSGQMVREFNIELARNQAPDWWAFYEMTLFMGETLALVAVGTDLSADDRAWLEESIQQGDDLYGAKDLYHEKYRPQIHFSTKRGWHNDPNGLVFDGTLWHMYYQYNPFGVTWGNMHWGSAVSPDLLHWVEQPIALYQRSLQDMAFSGGGFIDWQNTAGYQQGDQPPLIVAFTSTGRGECLAYSNDQGKTLTEFAENPVIQHQGRDPKILWYEPGQKWVMIVYEEIGGELGYAIYDSQNLKQWNRLSFMPGYFECPELFELPVDGKPEEKYWVIHGCRWEKSRSTGLIGKFDGAHFTVLQENLHSHFGPHFYAAQVFSDAPEQRRIMVGWMAGPQFPDMPFSQCMTVPLELSLRETSRGLRLCYFPVRELDALREGGMAIQATNVEQANHLLAEAAKYSDLLDIHLEVSTPEDHSFILDIRGNPLFYHPRTGELSFAGTQAHLEPGKKDLTLRVLVDCSVTEVFANGGEAAFASMTISAECSPIQLEGYTWVKELKVSRLKSIW